MSGLLLSSANRLFCCKSCATLTRFSSRNPLFPLRGLAKHLLAAGYTRYNEPIRHDQCNGDNFNRVRRRTGGASLFADASTHDESGSNHPGTSPATSDRTGASAITLHPAIDRRRGDLQGTACLQRCCCTRKLGSYCSDPRFTRCARCPSIAHVHCRTCTYRPLCWIACTLGRVATYRYGRFFDLHRHRRYRH